MAVSWVGSLNSHRTVRVDILHRSNIRIFSSELFDSYWVGISTVCCSLETVELKGFWGENVLIHFMSE